MIFTQEQINEIKKRLALAGIKDTQFPTANFPFKGDETFTIVQEGVNKKMSIDSFSEELLRYIHDYSGKDLFNVSEYIRKAQGASEYTPITLQEAVAALPEQLVHGGQIITFWNGSNWLLYQYYPSNGSWQELLSSEGDEKILPKCIEVIYYTDSSTLPARTLGNIGDYAIVNGAVYQKNASGWELDNIMSQEYFYFRYNDRLYEFREGGINSSIDFSIYLNDNLHHIYLPYFRKLSYSYAPPSNPSEGYYMYYTEELGYSLHYYSEVSGWSDVSEDTLAPCYFLSTGGLGNIIWEFRNDGNLYPGVEFKIDYSSLTNTPTIGNANLIFKYKGRNLTTFSANATNNVEVDLSNFASYDDLFNIINSKSLLRMKGTTEATLSLNTMTSDVTVNGEILYSTTLNRFVLKYLNGVITKYAKSWHSYGDSDSYNYVRASEYYNSEINNVVAPKADTLFYTIDTDTNRVQFYIYNGTFLIALNLGGGDIPTVDNRWIEGSHNAVESVVIQNSLNELDSKIDSKQATTIINSSEVKVNPKVTEYINNTVKSLSIQNTLNTPSGSVNVDNENSFVTDGNNIRYIVSKEIDITRDIRLGSNCIIEFVGTGCLFGVGNKSLGANVHKMDAADTVNVIVGTNKISNSNIVWSSKFKVGNATPELFGSIQLDTDFSLYNTIVYNKAIESDNDNVYTVDGFLEASVFNPDDYFKNNDHYGLGNGGTIAHYKSVYLYTYGDPGDQDYECCFILNFGIGKKLFYAFWANSDFWNERQDEYTTLPKARPAMVEKALSIKDVNGNYLCIQGVIKEYADTPADKKITFVRSYKSKFGTTYTLADGVLVTSETRIQPLENCNALWNAAVTAENINLDIYAPELIWVVYKGTGNNKTMVLLDDTIYPNAHAVLDEMTVGNYEVSTRLNVSPRMLVGRNSYEKAFFVARQNVDTPSYSILKNIVEEDDLPITGNEGDLIYYRDLQGTIPVNGDIYKYVSGSWMPQNADDDVFIRITSYTKEEVQNGNTVTVTYYVYTKYLYRKDSGDLVPLHKKESKESSISSVNQDCANFAYVSHDVYYNSDKKCFVLIDPFETTEDNKLIAYTAWNNSNEWNTKTSTNLLKAKSGTLFLNVEHDYLLNSYTWNKEVGNNKVMHLKYFDGNSLIDLQDTLYNAFDNIYYNKIPVINVLNTSNVANLPDNKVYYMGTSGEHLDKVFSGSSSRLASSFPKYLDGHNSKLLYIRNNKKYRRTFHGLCTNLSSLYVKFEHTIAASMQAKYGFLVPFTGNNSEVRIGSFGLNKYGGLINGIEGYGSISAELIKSIYGATEIINVGNLPIVRNVEFYCFKNSIIGTPTAAKNSFFRNGVGEPILGCIGSSFTLVNGSKDHCLQNVKAYNFYHILDGSASANSTLLYDAVKFVDAPEVFGLEGVKEISIYNSYMNQKKYTGGSGWHLLYGLDTKCEHFYMYNTTLESSELRNKEFFGWHSDSVIDGVTYANACKEVTFEQCSFNGFVNFSFRGSSTSNSRVTITGCDFNVWKQPVLTAGGIVGDFDNNGDIGVIFHEWVGALTVQNCRIKVSNIPFISSGTSANGLAQCYTKISNCTIHADMQNPGWTGDFVIRCNYKVILDNNVIKVFNGNLFKARSIVNVGIDAYNNYIETNNVAFYTNQSSTTAFADTIHADGNYVMFNQNSGNTCCMFRAKDENDSNDNKYGPGSYIKNTYLISKPSVEGEDLYKSILIYYQHGNRTTSIDQNNYLINSSNFVNVSFLDNKVYQTDGVKKINNRELPLKGGSTASRPADIPEGYCYLDTTLGFPIWAHWSGTTLTWLKADGTDADS